LKNKVEIFSIKKDGDLRAGTESECQNWVLSPDNTYSHLTSPCSLTVLLILIEGHEFI